MQVRRVFIIKERMMKKIMIMAMFLMASCSTTYVSVVKVINIYGVSNTVDQGGSALEGNSLDQKADGKLDIKAK